MIRGFPAGKAEKSISAGGNTAAHRQHGQIELAAVDELFGEIRSR